MSMPCARVNLIRCQFRRPIDNAAELMDEKRSVLSPTVRPTRVLSNNTNNNNNNDRHACQKLWLCHPNPRLPAKYTFQRNENESNGNGEKILIKCCSSVNSGRKFKYSLVGRYFSARCCCVCFYFGYARLRSSVAGAHPTSKPEPNERHENVG